ncbi:MAG: hypothetical protein LBP19_04695 [Treponema sp.]|jgi:hypothetical protein|nr:hypothetical protein [Treponema sp.]
MFTPRRISFIFGDTPDRPAHYGGAAESVHGGDLVIDGGTIAYRAVPRMSPALSCALPAKTVS